jgi:hypothetical protein
LFSGKIPKKIAVLTTFALLNLHKYSAHQRRLICDASKQQPTPVLPFGGASAKFLRDLPAKEL